MIEEKYPSDEIMAEYVRQQRQPKTPEVMTSPEKVKTLDLNITIGDEGVTLPQLHFLLKNNLVSAVVQSESDLTPRQDTLAKDHFAFGEEEVAKWEEKFGQTAPGVLTIEPARVGVQIDEEHAEDFNGRFYLNFGNLNKALQEGKIKIELNTYSNGQEQCFIEVA